MLQSLKRGSCVTTAGDGSTWCAKYQDGAGTFVPSTDWCTHVAHLAHADQAISFALSFLVAHHQHEDVVWPTHPRDPAPASIKISPWLFGSKGGWNRKSMYKYFRHTKYGNIMTHVADNGMDLMFVGSRHQGGFRIAFLKDLPMRLMKR